MAILPSTTSDLLPGQQTAPVSKKMMQTPSHATVTAIAAGRTTSPPTEGRPKAPRRTSSTTSAATNRKDTQEKRANHNAIERARRDSLNQRFLVLASNIPSISEVRRPSKSLIVNRSLQFVTEALSREAYYRQMITDLHDRTRVLTEQLNEYRLANGLQNYVETVPELSLPVAMIDAPKDKPTARIVGRKGSNPSEWDGLDETENGLEEYEDGITMMTPSGLEDQVSFFSQPSSLYTPTSTSSMTTSQLSHYETVGPNPTTTNHGYSSIPTPHDVNGTTFFHQPISASPITSSPGSQSDMVGQSPSLQSSLTDSTFSPITMTQSAGRSTDLLTNWNKMFSFTMGNSTDMNATSSMELPTDFASLLASPAYHSTA